MRRKGRKKRGVRGGGEKGGSYSAHQQRGVSNRAAANLDIYIAGYRTRASAKWDHRIGPGLVTLAAHYSKPALLLTK